MAFLAQQVPAPPGSPQTVLCQKPKSSHVRRLRSQPRDGRGQKDLRAAGSSGTARELLTARSRVRRERGHSGTDGQTGCSCSGALRASIRTGSLRLSPWQGRLKGDKALITALASLVPRGGFSSSFRCSGQGLGEQVPDSSPRSLPCRQRQLGSPAEEQPRWCFVIHFKLK